MSGINGNAIRMVKNGPGLPESNQHTERLHCILSRPCDVGEEFFVCRFLDPDRHICRFHLGQVHLGAGFSLEDLGECPLDGSIRGRDAFLNQG